MSISPESIYRFAYHHQTRQDDCWRKRLPQARSKRGRRKRGGGATRKSFKDYVSIEQRPAEISTRETPGHWEADQPALAKGKPKMVVRFAMAHKLLTRLNAKARDTHKEFALAA